MNIKKFTAYMIVAAFVISAFGGAISVSDVDAAAKAPKLNTANKTVEAGKSFKLTIRKKGIKIKKTKWKTGKKKIASISKAGKTSVKVTAKNAGVAKITAMVKYTAGKKAAKKKLSCKVTVTAAKNAALPTSAAQIQNGGASTNQPVKATEQPTATPVPYYYDYDYFAMFNGDNADGKENMFINFVLSDSWQTNTKLSAIESLEFAVDSAQELDIDVYVSEWDCDIDKDDAKKITTIHTDGTKGQNISLTDEIAGNADIKALDSTNNGRISFGFSTSDGNGQFVIHDMYVNYHNNNTGGTSHHKAAISVVTSAVGSAASAYSADKKAADDADEDFSGTLDEYMAKKPGGLFEARPKDASDAVNNYTSMADITEAKGYKFGTCVTYSQIKNDAEFCKLLAHHCDSITAMNEFKAYSILDGDASRANWTDDETSMPALRFDKADYICEWAKDNGLQIRGHALVWDNSMKQWFFTKGYKDDSADYASNEICRKRLQYYVDQVMRHFQEKYPDVVYCWDVVNEGIDENSADKLKIRQNRGVENYFYYHCSSQPNGKGEDYVKFTFQCAYDTREAMINEGLLSDRSKLELVYNDYNVIESNKRPYVKALVEYLNSGGEQLCDAVGCQGYLGAYQKQQGCLSMSWVDKTTTTIKEFASMDPPVHVQLTEMAMRNFDWDYLDDKQNGEYSHGEFAANLFEGLANINSETDNAFTSMSIWAFIDDPIMNKVDESFDYWQYAPFSGMFDEVYRVKPAFEHAYQILQQ